MKFVGGVSSDVGVQNERLCVRCHRYKFFAGSGLVSPGASFSNSRKVLPEVFSKCFVVVAAEEVHHRREILSR